MKQIKIWVIALLAITVPAITSCNGKPSNERNTSDDEDYIEETKEPEHEIVEGTWNGDVDLGEEMIQSTVMTIKFSGRDGGDFKMGMQLTIAANEGGMQMTMDMGFDVKGEWKWSDDDIKLDFDNSTAELKLMDLNLKGMGLSKAEKNEIKKMVEAEMKKQVTEDLADMFAKDRLRNVKVEGNTFTCTFKGKMITFNRK